MREFPKKQETKLLKKSFVQQNVLCNSPKYLENEILGIIILHFCIQCHIIGPENNAKRAKG